jgi:hypothetical protein
VNEDVAITFVRGAGANHVCAEILVTQKRGVVEPLHTVSIRIAIHGQLVRIPGSSPIRGTPFTAFLSGAEVFFTKLLGAYFPFNALSFRITVHGNHIGVFPSRSGVAWIPA